MRWSFYTDKRDFGLLFDQYEHTDNDGCYCADLLRVFKRKEVTDTVHKEEDYFCDD